MTADTLQSAALYYASFNLPVFPCEPRGKAPIGRLVPHGLKDASTDPERIAQWWAAEPEANVGIAVPEGFVVVDVDGPDGQASVEGRGFPDTPSARTGHGLHFWFKLPEGLKAKNATRLLPGVDLRTVGGYVVAPPSTHPSGGSYSWESDLVFGEVPVAPCPSWLADLIRAKQTPKATTTAKAPTIVNADAYGAKVLREEADAVRRAAQGTRNHTLNHASFKVGQLVADGRIDRASAEAELMAAALACGLPEAEARKTIASGLTGGTAKPRATAVPARGDNKPGGNGNGFSLVAEKPEPPTAKTDAKRLLAVDLHRAPADSDIGLQRLFASMAEGRLISSHGRGWFSWVGTHWQPDPDAPNLLANRLPEALLHAALAVTDNPEQRGAFAKAAAKAQRHQVRLNAIAGAAPMLRVPDDDLDRDLYLLACPNGTLDLRSGMLRAPDPEDHITRITSAAFNPDAQGEAWQAFLETILPSAEVREFVRRAVGYSLVGDCVERALFVCHGSGRNGKSTFLRAIQDALGDYAGQVSSDLFLVSRAEDTRVAVELMGKRFVAASETGEDRKLRENFIKGVTGRDRVKARLLYHEKFEFVPEATLWLGTNHRPRIAGSDPAIWDRVQLVPFTVRIPDDAIDLHIGDRLAAEAEAVLAWAVAGCADWWRDGLQPPTEVRAVTDEYRATEDILGEWLEEQCERDRGASALHADLYKAFRQWHEERGDKPPSTRAFGMALEERGFGKGRAAGGGRQWSGLRLKGDSQ